MLINAGWRPVGVSEKLAQKILSLEGPRGHCESNSVTLGEGESSDLRSALGGWIVCIGLLEVGRTVGLGAVRGSEIAQSISDVLFLCLGREFCAGNLNWKG